MLRDLSKWTMYLGLGVAMVAGATWPSPTWAGVAVGLAIVGAGIAMKRAAGAPTIEEHADVGGEKPPRTGSIEDALEHVAREVEALAGEAVSADFEAVKKKVEGLIWLGPERLGQAQEAVAARIGFAAYAEVMAPLATAERLMYRAWSAATDGHRPETINSLSAAVPYAKEAASLAKGKLGA